MLLRTLLSPVWAVQFTSLRARNSRLHSTACHRSFSSSLAAQPPTIASKGTSHVYTDPFVGLNQQELAMTDKQCYQRQPQLQLKLPRTSTHSRPCRSLSAAWHQQGRCNASVIQITYAWSWSLYSASLANCWQESFVNCSCCDACNQLTCCIQHLFVWLQRRFVTFGQCMKNDLWTMHEECISFNLLETAVRNRDILAKYISWSARHMSHPRTWRRTMNCLVFHSCVFLHALPVKLEQPSASLLQNTSH